MSTQYFMGQGVFYPPRMLNLTINGEPRLLEHMSDETLARWRPLADRNKNCHSFALLESRTGSFDDEQFIDRIEINRQAFCDELDRRAHRREIEAAAQVPSREHAAETKGGRL